MTVSLTHTLWFHLPSSGPVSTLCLTVKPVLGHFNFTSVISLLYALLCPTPNTAFFVHPYYLSPGLLTSLLTSFLASSLLPTPVLI